MRRHQCNFALWIEVIKILINNELLNQVSIIYCKIFNTVYMKRIKHLKKFLIIIEVLTLHVQKIIIFLDLQWNNKCTKNTRTKKNTKSRIIFVVNNKSILAKYHNITNLQCHFFQYLFINLINLLNLSQGVINVIGLQQKIFKYYIFIKILEKL